ncbi:MAG TPA: hypothetical protein VEF04_13720 [Blastocatellia bacterium]|nr:hypothetical protein [Blastocatellia bacterium]
MTVNNKITKVIEENVQQPYIEFKKKHNVLAGFLSLFVALMIAIVALVSGKTKSAHADATTQMEIAAPVIASPGADSAAHDHSHDDDASQTQSFAVPIKNNDGLALAASSHVPASPVGVSKRPEVKLTEDMAELSESIGNFLEKNRRYAIITSGVRSGESQLGLIKQRITEKGGQKLHAGIFNATLKDSTVWAKAWRWLANKRVPINPPADIVQNGRVVKKSSDHLRGNAIDLISPNLRDLHKQLTKYAASKEAKQQDLRITAVVLEPYCVHIKFS